MKLLPFFILLFGTVFAQDCEVVYDYQIFEDYSKCLSGIRSIDKGTVLLPAEYNFIELIESEVDDADHYELLVQHSNGLSGVLDCHLNVLIPVEYQSIKKIWNLPKHWYVQVNGKFGVMLSDATWLIEPKYDRIYRLTGFRERDSVYWSVSNNGLSGILKHDGEVLVPVEYESVEKRMPTEYSDFILKPSYPLYVNQDNLFVKKNGKIGVLRSDGTPLIPVEYDFGTISKMSTNKNFGSVDSAYFFTMRQDDMTALIDAKGNTMTQSKEIKLCGVHQIVLDSTLQLITWTTSVEWVTDSSGTRRTRLTTKLGHPGVDQQETVQGGITGLGRYGVIVSDRFDSNYRLFNANLDELLVTRNAMTFTPANHSYLVETIAVTNPGGAYHTVLGKNGKLMLDTLYRNVSVTGEAPRYTYWAHNADSNGTMRVFADGTKIGAFEFDSLVENQFSAPIFWSAYYGKKYNPDALLFVKSKGKWGALNEKLEAIVPFEYDQFVGEQYAPGGINSCVLIKNEKLGAVGLDGQEVVPFEYDFIQRNFFKDYDLYGKNGTYLVMDSSGNVLVDAAISVFKEWQDLELKQVDFNPDEPLFFAVKDGHMHVFDGTSFQRFDAHVIMDWDLKIFGNALVNSKGDAIYVSDLSKIRAYHDLFVANSDSSLEFISSDGKVLYRTDDFAYGGTYDDTYVFADHSGKKHVLNGTFQEMTLPEHFEEVIPTKMFGDTYLWTRLYVPYSEDSLQTILAWRLFNTDGKEIPIRNERGEVQNFSSPGSPEDPNGFCIVNNSKKYGLLNDRFELVVPPSYKCIERNTALGFYMLWRGDSVTLYDPVKNSFLPGWSQVGTFSINGYFTANPVGTDAVTVLKWDSISGIQTIVAPMPLDELVMQQSFQALFGVTNEQEKNIHQAFGYYFVSNKWVEKNGWQCQNYLLFHFLQRRVFPYEQSNISLWSVNHIGESSVFAPYGNLLFTNAPERSFENAFRLDDYFGRTSMAYNNTRNTDSRDFEHLHTFFEGVGLYSFSYGDRHYNYSFKDGAAPVALLTMFKDENHAKEVLNKKIREEIMRKQVFGQSCPNLDAIIPEMMDNWYFSEAGLVFRYQYVSVCVNYEEIYDSFKKNYQGYIKRIERKRRD